MGRFGENFGEFRENESPQNPVSNSPGSWGAQGRGGGGSGFTPISGGLGACGNRAQRGRGPEGFLERFSGGISYPNLGFRGAGGVGAEGRGRGARLGFHLQIFGGEGKFGGGLGDPSHPKYPKSSRPDPKNPLRTTLNAPSFPKIPPNSPGKSRGASGFQGGSGGLALPPPLKAQSNWRREG